MEAKRHIEPHRPVFALTGCKLDLVSNGAQREVSKDEAKAFAEQNGLFFVETSARTGVNVEEVFNMVTQEVCFGQSIPAIPFPFRKNYSHFNSFFLVPQSIGV